MRYSLGGVRLSLVLADAVVGQDRTAEKQAGPFPLANGPWVDKTQFYYYDCQANYEEEPIAQRHAAAGINCVKCHGVSIVHASDEAHFTAPDIMYPKEKIRTACLECHSSQESEDVHKVAFASSKIKKQACTDCHGEHRLNWEDTLQFLRQNQRGEMNRGFCSSTIVAHFMASERCQSLIKREAR